jgi:hypothetical protein
LGNLDQGCVETQQAISSATFGKPSRFRLVSRVSLCLSGLPLLVAQGSWKAHSNELECKSVHAAGPLLFVLTKESKSTTDGQLFLCMVCAVAVCLFVSTPLPTSWNLLLSCLLAGGRHCLRLPHAQVEAHRRWPSHVRCGSRRHIGGCLQIQPQECRRVEDRAADQAPPPCGLNATGISCPVLVVCPFLYEILLFESLELGGCGGSVRTCSVREVVVGGCGGIVPESMD